LFLRNLFIYPYHNYFSENFVKYCDPERKNNTFWTHNNEHSHFSVKTSEHQHVSVQTSAQNTPYTSVPTLPKIDCEHKPSVQSEHSTSNINQPSVQCTLDLMYTDYESVKIMHSENTEEISLLDIDPLLRKSSVVQYFINK
jgi:hypothetical protein